MGIIDTVSGSLFKKGGSITEDLFGYEGATLTAYLDLVFSDGQKHSDALKFFYQQLYRDFSPDINGYTLVFFTPPDLSGYRLNLDGHLYTLYGQDNPSSYMSTVGKIMTFAAVDFTPPQNQVRTENVSTRSGSIPIASEVSESETMSITFVDNRQLDIYMFHHLWVEYIREILEGTIEPKDSYYASEDDDDTKSFYNVDYYGAIDYAASCYIVKYRPDMRTVTFVAKCVGIFPQSLPNKELIGTRTSNEIVTLPFTYSCSGYRESLYMEKEAGNWIFGELDTVVSRFSSQSGSSPLFGGFLGGVLNSVIGPTSSALNNLTGNAAQLGGIVGNLQNATTSMWSAVKGIAGPDGFSKIINVSPK
jgi:hypothetical protein